jgi:N-acetylneuraminate synthase
MIPPENGILKHAVERGVLSTEAVERLTFSGFTNTTNGDLKRALEFTEEEYRAIADYALAHSLVFFASPWDVASVTFLERLAVPCHKVASACLTDEALLRALRDTKKPILLSTGMSTFQEIARAVSILGKDNLALLHTVSTYPTENSHLNLLVMQTLAAEFWGVPIGYSGHEKGILPSIIASALGAAVIERHITLDKRMWGSDQPASLEPREFAEMVEGIREARIVLGDGIKRVLPQEEAVRDKLRRVHFEW